MILINDVVDVLSGYAFQSSLFNDKGDGLPLVRIRDVGKKESKTFFSGSYKNEFLLKNGDFIIGMDGDFRLAIWQGGQALLNQRVCKVTAKEEKIYPKYLYYVLPKELKKIEDVTSFATVKHLSVKGIKGIEIPLPPLAEQQKIAAILDAADTLRQKDQQLIDHYTTLSQSLFLEMFGDPVTNPMGWEVLSVNQCISKNMILEIQDGNHGEVHPKVADFSDKGFPFVAANVVRDGKILFDKCYYLENIWLKKLRVGFAKPHDVLISHKGSLGYTAVLDDTFETYIFSPQTTYYRLDSKKITPIYLKGYFDTHYFQRLFNSRGIQSTRAYLGVTKQKQLPISLPPMELQNQFAERIKAIEAQKQQAQASLEHSKALFNSLLQRAFSGELS